MEGALNTTTSATVTAWAGTYTLNMVSLDNSEYGCCKSGLITVLPYSGPPCFPWGFRVTENDSSNINEQVKIYPNPTEGNFYIEGFNTGEEEEANITISNVTGQTIYNGKITLQHGAWKYEGDLKRAGVYLIRIDTKAATYRNTIISIKD